MTYFNPYAGNADRSREHWLNYLNKATIAKYTADSIGGFIERSSRAQLAALDHLNETQKVGFGRINDGLGEANRWLESMDARLALGLEEQRIGNVLAENIANSSTSRRVKRSATAGSRWG